MYIILFVLIIGVIFYRKNVYEKKEVSERKADNPELNERMLAKKKDEEERNRRKDEEEEIRLNKKMKLYNRIDRLKEGFRRNKELVQNLAAVNNSGIDKWELKKIGELSLSYKKNIYEEKLEHLRILCESQDKKSIVIEELNELDEILRKDSFFISKYEE